MASSSAVSLSRSSFAKVYGPATGCLCSGTLRIAGVLIVVIDLVLGIGRPIAILPAFAVFDIVDLALHVAEHLLLERCELAIHRDGRLVRGHEPIQLVALLGQTEELPFNKTFWLFNIAKWVAVEGELPARLADTMFARTALKHLALPRRQSRNWTAVSCARLGSPANSF